MNYNLEAALETSLETLTRKAAGNTSTGNRKLAIKTKSYHNSVSVSCSFFVFGVAEFP